jgi:hypothetical protein
MPSSHLTRHQRVKLVPSADTPLKAVLCLMLIHTRKDNGLLVVVILEVLKTLNASIA